MLIEPGSTIENRINSLSCIINKKRALDIFAHRHCFNKMRNPLCKMVVWSIHLPPNCKMHSNCTKDDYTHTHTGNYIVTCMLCHYTQVSLIYCSCFHSEVPSHCLQTEAHFLYFLHIQFYNDHFIAEVSFWVFFSSSVFWYRYLFICT